MKFATLFIALLPIVVVTAAPNPQEESTLIQTSTTETGPTTSESVTGNVSAPESTLIQTSLTNPVTTEPSESPSTSVSSSSIPTTSPSTTTSRTTSSGATSAPQTTSTNGAFTPRADNMAAAGIVAGIIAALV